MPLPNSDEMQWSGWLADNAGSQCELFRALLAQKIEDKGIPKCKVTLGTINMWWRKDSLYIDVESSLDGTTISTIHIQEYGTGLWVGRAIDGNAWRWNYYKRMATGAFIETVDRCIRDALLSIVEESALHSVSDFVKPGGDK